MLRRMIEIPGNVAHYSFGSVLLVARLVSLGFEARRAERLAAE